jgi:FO synthase subunit 1
VREVLDCGVDDLGGVSPVTDDHINPAHAWPALTDLQAMADEAGLGLRERLPVHERYLPPAIGASDVDPPRERQWISDRILEAIRAPDEAGERYRAVLDGGTLRNDADGGGEPSEPTQAD